ncbi:MAG: hypothetical protein U9R36_05470, partial [Elusimicrobiota bacterium]|nr:hypothetical protein [Elusimicrobiota bacterium]
RPLPQMNKKLEWNLDCILPLAGFDSYLKEIKKYLQKAADYTRDLSPSMAAESFKKTVDYTEDIKIRLSRLSYPGHLMESVNQKSLRARKLKGRAAALAVEVPDIFKYEWAYIPHIVNSPFYCYTYNFGELLTLSLYSLYRSDPDKYLSKILKIFKAGGSVSPQKILGELSLDMESEKFWQSGFKIIKKWQKELEEI